MDSKKIGAFIAELRKEKGLTQAALAEQLNISNRTVSKWENGDGYPDITTVPTLAEILEVTTDELFNGARAEKIETDEKEKPIFEVTFTETSREWNEAFNSYFGKIMPNGLFILIAIFTEVVGILALRSSAMFGIDIPSSFRVMLIIFAVALTLFILMMLLVGPIHMVNTRSLNNGVKAPTFIAFSDRIYLTEGKVSQIFDYKDITQAKITKKMYVIFFGKVMQYIPKYAVEDCAEEFEAFLTEKAPKVKRYKWNVVHKIFAVLAIIGIAFFVVINFNLPTDAEATTPYYGDMDTKLNYFIDNEKAFEFGLKNVQSDKELEKAIEEDIRKYDYATFDASDYLPLGTIHSVTVTENAIVFEANFAETQYYNGYIFYEGEGNPFPYQIGYRKTGVDDYEANYIAEDDLYLYGKEDNETPTFTPWYLVKPVGENWYYYEYHTDAQ